MTWKEIISDKIRSRDSLRSKVEEWKGLADSVVFTNGCFDILHRGHLEYLSQAADLGDRLIIGLNSDNSVKRLKGEERPLNIEGDRLKMLASLEFVDAVCLFEEDTPIELIRKLNPDILVKGGDYGVKDIVGADYVMSTGGKVEIIPFVEGYSTTSLIERVKKL